MIDVKVKEDPRSAGDGLYVVYHKGVQVASIGRSLHCDGWFWLFHSPADRRPYIQKTDSYQEAIYGFLEEYERELKKKEETLQYGKHNVIYQDELEPETVARLRETAFREAIKAYPEADPKTVCAIAENFYLFMRGRQEDHPAELALEMAKAIKTLKCANDRAGKWGLSTLSQADINHLEALLKRAERLGDIG